MLHESFQQHDAADRSTAAARAAMAHWPASLQAPLSTDNNCQTGPTTTCAMLGTEPAEVRWWPEENWSRAWLPLAQWRTAHSTALEASRSAYGRALIRHGANGVRPIFGPILATAVRYSGQPSWRISLLVPAQADRAFNGDAPLLGDSPVGPVARFSDGMVLPVRYDNGHASILAQGPADQAARMVAALKQARDPGTLALPPVEPVANAAPLMVVPSTVNLSAFDRSSPLVFGPRATEGPLAMPATDYP